MSAERLQETLSHIRAGDYDVALSSCRDVIERHPDDADAVHLAGYLHQLRGEHEDALRYFALAERLAPHNAEILNNHAGSLKALQRLEESEGYYRRAIALDPGFVLAHHNFADLLLSLKRPAEAMVRCRAALELDPGLAETYRTLGLSLEHQGRYEEAIAAHRESAARGGSRAGADFGEALVRLLTGDFTAGWEKYEARLEAPSVRSLHERFDYPRWRGASLARRTLLVPREQGLGDEIMFASCFGELTPLAARCFITCDRRLEPLFARSFPAATSSPAPRPSCASAWRARRWTSRCPPAACRSYSARAARTSRRIRATCGPIRRASSTGARASPRSAAGAGSAFRGAGVFRPPAAAAARSRSPSCGRCSKCPAPASSACSTVRSPMRLRRSSATTRSASSTGLKSSKAATTPRR